MAFETTDGGYTLSDDPARFDLARAHRWISCESYWAEGIPLATLEKACANSLVVGAYGPAGMAAMARVVTDRATFGWVCDVFVDAGARGEGLGKRLMAYLKAHPDLQGLRRLHLATRDAHDLYRQFGFTELTKVENWMEIRDPDVYRR
jgi:N-acetylglutamate synthase-like GNAT family acetyltransferase